ncbi:hypothetical protein AVEN_210969-1 [Araneus ventricosus]|uniref:Uncharacterized protein n=1 Tax=Araneus ventricosus TaxID=182803 RepID=A0A4Y2DGK2_ARAVE|nr:hypothetical protein AVEN_210969-1 [Araneus ventricosus]
MVNLLSPHPPVPSSLLAALIRNLYIVVLKANSLSKEKSRMGPDQGNKLVMEVPKCDASTGNLTPRGTCEPAHYRDEAPAHNFALQRSGCSRLTMQNHVDLTEFNVFFIQSAEGIS